MVISCVASAAYCQIDTKSWMFGLSTNTSITYSQITHISLFNNLSLKGGFFVDNLLLGITYSHVEFSDMYTSTSRTTLGGYTRYYFLRNIFTGLSIGSTRESYNSTYGYVNNYLAVQLEFGVALFISKGIAIEPSITFGSYYAAIGFSIGISGYLNRKK